MPWRVDTMRFRLVKEVLRREESVAAICRRYGVSRKTAYKWLERFELEGRQGLGDRKRAPHRQALALDREVEAAVVKLRRRHGWGARKLHRMLQRGALGPRTPSVSTIETLLKRRGLKSMRARRHHVPLWREKFTPADRCNRVWRADYKGYFFTGDGERIEPLTVTDGRSRYLVSLTCCRSTGEKEARHAFDAAFKRYGLPDVILTDNGNPFATPSLTGLTRLSVWFIKLGIRHERTAPASPDQNGGQERFHRTLREAVVAPAAATRTAQVRRCARFTHEYNEIRPHEALGLDTPASVYRASTRKLPARLAPPSYPPSAQVRRVRTNGTIKWQGKLLYVGEVLARELLAVQVDAVDGKARVHFYDRVLGTISPRGDKIFLRGEAPPPRGRRLASKLTKSRKV